MRDSYVRKGGDKKHLLRIPSIAHFLVVGTSSGEVHIAYNWSGESLNSVYVFLELRRTSTPTWGLTPVACATYLTTRIISYSYDSRRATTHAPILH